MYSRATRCEPIGQHEFFAAYLYDMVHVDDGCSMALRKLLRQVFDDVAQKIGLQVSSFPGKNYNSMVGACQVEDFVVGDFYNLIPGEDPRRNGGFYATKYRDSRG